MNGKTAVRIGHPLLSLQVAGEWKILSTGSEIPREAVFVFFLLTFYRPGEGAKEHIQCRIQSQKAMRLPSNRGFSRITAKLFTTIFSIIVSLVSNHSLDGLLGFFFSRRNLGLPHTSPAGEWNLTSIWFGGEGHTPWGRGGPIRTRGQTLWYSMYICNLCQY